MSLTETQLCAFSLNGNWTFKREREREKWIGSMVLAEAIK